ncbi:MAG: energy-coupled thiamine transporter ThiT [Firmicutes bacterium]|nr:energy-coupled thiamine transporter ThiT [Bacillota bacterium]
MTLQEFIESTAGQIVLIAVIIAFFLIIFLTGKGKKTDTKALIFSALLVALAMVLDQIKLFTMPQGGSVTPFSLLPIVLCGYFFGLRRGVLAGFCMGLLQLLFSPYVIHPIQMLLDYPIAFGALAFGAVLRNSRKGALIKTYIMGVACRYAFAVLSGVIFFGAYIPDPRFNALTWSLWYNFTYTVIEAGVTIAILFIPAVSNMFKQLRSQISTT